MAINDCGDKIKCTQDAVVSTALVWVRTVGASCSRETRKTTYYNDDCTQYVRYAELDGTPVPGVLGTDYVIGEAPQTTFSCNPVIPPPPPPPHLVNNLPSTWTSSNGVLSVTPNGADGYTFTMNATAFCAAVNACIGPLTPLTLQQVLGTLPTWLGASGAGDDIITFNFSQSGFEIAVRDAMPDQTVTGTMPTWFQLTGVGENEVATVFDPLAFCTAVVACMPNQTVSGTKPPWVTMTGVGKNDVVVNYDAAVFRDEVAAAVCARATTTSPLTQVLGRNADGCPVWAAPVQEYVHTDHVVVESPTSPIPFIGFNNSGAVTTASFSNALFCGAVNACVPSLPLQTINGSTLPFSVLGGGLTFTPNGTNDITITENVAALTTFICGLNCVAPPSPCPTPSVVSPLSPSSGAQLQPYFGTIVVSDTTSATLTGLPPGLSYSFTGGTVISVVGTPSVVFGPGAITANLTNACGGGLATVSVNNVDVGVLTIDTACDPCEFSIAATARNPSHSGADCDAFDLTVSGLCPGSVLTLQDDPPVFTFSQTSFTANGVYTVTVSPAPLVSGDAITSVSASLAGCLDKTVNLSVPVYCAQPIYPCRSCVPTDTSTSVDLSADWPLFGNPSCQTGPGSPILGRWLLFRISPSSVQIIASLPASASLSYAKSVLGLVGSPGDYFAIAVATERVGGFGGIVDSAIDPARPLAEWCVNFVPGTQSLCILPGGSPNGCPYGTFLYTGNVQNATAWVVP